LLLTPYEYNAKHYNKRASLDMVRFTPGGISRVELARQLGLTRSAVTAIINDLLKKELVRETESGPVTGGRRAILLELNPNHGKLVGIDMGATHLNIVVTDFSARVLFEVEIPFDVRLGPGECLKIVDQHLRDTLKQASLPLEEVLAIGVGVPGPVV